MNEHRKEQRYAVGLDVVVESDGDKVAGRTHNLSRGGLCMVASTAIPVSTVCQLHVALIFAENQFSEHLTLPATVVWCTALGGGKQQIGFKFGPLEAKLKGYLDVFIKFLDEREEDA